MSDKRKSTFFCVGRGLFCFHFLHSRTGTSEVRHDKRKHLWDAPGNEFVALLFLSYCVRYLHYVVSNVSYSDMNDKPTLFKGESQVMLKHDMWNKTLNTNWFILDAQTRVKRLCLNI